MYKLKLVAKINIKKLNVSTKNLYTLVPVDMTVNNSILTTFEIAEMRKKWTNEQKWQIFIMVHQAREENQT